MTPLGPVRRLIVHHSASSLSTTVDDIRRWHVEGNGWNGIQLYGHRDVSSGTECPGLDVRALLTGPRFGS